MRRYRREGLEFDVLDLGPSGAETIVLLHGFPQGSRAWIEVGPALASAGFRVLVPNQRGYSPGARPRQLHAYCLDELRKDLTALLDAVGVTSAHVVGHDLGGAVAWAAAEDSPHRLKSLTLLSMPPPRALCRALFTGNQAYKSWYVLFLLLPMLPEVLVKAAGGSLAVSWLMRTGLPRDVASVYIRQLRTGQSAATGALSWYRALPFWLRHVLPRPPVDVPTMLIWSDRDVAVGRRAASLTSRYVRAAYQFVELPGRSHWLPEQAPDMITKLILRHIQCTSSYAAAPENCEERR